MNDPVFCELLVVEIKGRGSGLANPELTTTTANLKRSSKGMSRTIKAHSKPEPTHQMANTASLPDYQLGEVLGRGAFGCVFRALNWCTGETVAVKQVGLSNIPRSELPEIMSEIDLLKNLDHPNIVQYRGFVKTSDYLYIILEYCENGSLHTICKKFGKFPESLVAVYICQVLEGLLYLHEQGVIHRDIKGSNILATKEGGVKLADFGVATRTGGLSDNAVVGSPYWMAPEVVDQSGATTASDIWSVGCVVIELLEGKPPYYFLDPMPALFRIVNDDCPPLPESASPIARDFLLQCFQKDQNLRISAKKLLKHPWMLSAKKRLEQKEREQALAQTRRTPYNQNSRKNSNHNHNSASPRSSSQDIDNSKTGYDETVQRVQDWNKALEESPTAVHPKTGTGNEASPHRVLNHLTSSTTTTTTTSPNATTAHRVNEDVRPKPITRPSYTNGNSSMGPSKVISSSLSQYQDESSSTALLKNSTIRGLNKPIPVSSSTPTNLPLTVVISTTPPARKLAEIGIESMTQGDNWDDDFEGGISTSKIAALDEAHTNSSSSGSSESEDDNDHPDNNNDEDEDDDDDDDQDESCRTRRLVDNTATIKPTTTTGAGMITKSPNLGKSLGGGGTAGLGAIVEDYSDLVGDDQRDPFEGKVASLKVLNQHQKILHPKDISLPNSETPAGGGGGGLKSRLSSVLTHRSNSPTITSRSSESPILSYNSTTHKRLSLNSSSMNRSHSSPITSSSSSTSVVVSNDSDNLNRFAEVDHVDDYDDLFAAKNSSDPNLNSSHSQSQNLNQSQNQNQGRDQNQSRDHQNKRNDNDHHHHHHHLNQFQSTETLKLQTRLSNMSSKSWLGDEDSDEIDPFAEVDEENFATEEATLEANLARDRLARLSTLVTEIVDQMSPDIDEVSLKDGCMQLIGLFEDTPEIRTHFVRSHGMLAVIELLQQFQRSRDLVSLLLRTINLIINDDPESLEKICYNGGCPVVMGFASNKYAREIRLEAALFIGSMCQTSLLTLQMFISCRGLKVLVEMMDENYDEQKDLVWMAVDGICRVFELQGPTPRNDFCRMFAHEGLLEPLSEALLHVSHDDDDLAENAKGRIVHIFLLFSQADMKVKEIMLTRAIILRLIRSLSILENELLVSMLKTLKNLTMLPAGLQVLQNANAIETLTKVLKEQIERDPDTPLTTEIANHVVNALYNLCRLSKPRQEEAALAGAIPILQRVVKSSSPLKQFALPILCDFAHTSKTCRKLLWQKDGFAFYLGLLRDPFWGITALESILAWLSDETARVEDALTEPSSIEALLRMFTKAKATTFENLLDPLLKLFRISPTVGTSLISQPAFAKRLVDRLLSHNKAVVRLNLLRLTKAVFETAVEKTTVVKMSGLAAAINKMADSESAILVRELAKELNREFCTITSPTKSIKKPLRHSPQSGPRSSIGTLSLPGEDHLNLPHRKNVPISGPSGGNRLANSRSLSRDTLNQMARSSSSTSSSSDQIIPSLTSSPSTTTGLGISLSSHASSPTLNNGSPGSRLSVDRVLVSRPSFLLNQRRSSNTPPPP
ncbi:hypothetical protein Pst134EA_007399 [Puccinia striiformis f. sp. tritici]|uniref:hypothetical protein n=1 Tax=Puccinia striiformis f. sp. tritici TaxID=168172 RepID=UPI002007BAB6|nr:hypothetical protein Pst134EA_007399 [Puccinia striiformis f. sp. tritici]KAH9470133.1 hypothetical protein Pst134EA_007399 [Puccinia striiformis f. sp. tritici]